MQIIFRLFMLIQCEFQALATNKTIATLPNPQHAYRYLGAQERHLNRNSLYDLII